MVKKKLLISARRLNKTSMLRRVDNPVDTGRKLNVHKTFNLRSVSTGNSWEIKSDCDLENFNSLLQNDSFRMLLSSYFF